MNNDTKKLVVGFGELLGAIRSEGYAAWGDSNRMEICAGGSEANVLAKVGGLAAGIRTQFISRMKNDLMGRLLRYELQKYTVGLDHVIWTDSDRNGLCFVEQGLGPITAEGGYDRAYSAFTNASVGEFDFSILKNADAFFVSGITPALNQNCHENTKRSLRMAKEHHIPTFVDINYRNKLWTAQQARDALSKMIAGELFTTLITTETDARVVFGVDEGFDDDKSMDDLIACSKRILKTLNTAIGGRVPVLIMTLRKRITNERGEWTSLALVEGQTVLVGDRFDYIVLDRYGAGDSCSAGIIGGYLGITPEGVIDDTLSLEQRLQNGLNLGNRMSVVVQKTISDLGPQWPAIEYFKRVGRSREIAR